MHINRDRRGKRMLAATMRTERIADQPIIIRDVSRRGIGARATVSGPIVGERVTIRTNDGQEVAGKVQWARESRFGIELERDINPDAFQAAGTSWDITDRPFPRGHVYDQFKPVSKPYRPGLKSK
jgi:hypothetical protein